MNSSSIDNLLAEATNKGMYLVDHSNIQQLLNEYDDTVLEADELSERVDNETTPYESKYKARKLLDTLINKLDATRSIAIVENNKNTLHEMNIRLASLRVRVGTISWECEEPHNAQTDLELSIEFYFPGLVQSYIDICSENGINDETSTIQITSENVKKPIKLLPVLSMNIIVDAMKSLNLLGILWAGRGQVQKSMLYLLSAYDFYHSVNTSYQSNNKFTASIIKDLGLVYTHNLFYLAQAYGNIGDTKKSCEYCHLTLQRQYNDGLKDIKIKLDWIKNCCSISDFYLAMKQYNNCALALGSAEYLLKTYTFPQIIKYNEDKGNSTNLTLYSSGNLNSLEIEAELYRKWVVLDVYILKRSFDLENIFQNNIKCMMDSFEEQNMRDSIYNEYNNHMDDFVLPTSSTTITTAMDMDTTHQQFSMNDDKKKRYHEFILGIPVELHVCNYLQNKDIKCFEDARQVFLRAVTRIELAKKYYVLDGYVTDHVLLLQEHSKLYHYLSIFESDLKRKAAMENRRIDLLANLLNKLNRTSYDVLHKQISYELGECALNMLEIKLDKFRDPNTGEVNEKILKKNEIVKINDYCKLGLVMFSHFTCMYLPLKKIQENSLIYVKEYFETQPLHVLVHLGCMEPDEALISEEEVRPFLNAHFLCCRLISKIVSIPLYWPPGNIGTGQRTHFMVSCLKRYEWLSKFTIKICSKHNINVTDIFNEEYKICLDMIKLLPSKIDRMCYLGESGLSL